MLFNSVVFVKNNPISIRNPSKLNDNVEYLKGISSFDLERVETKLAQEIRDSIVENGKISIYMQVFHVIP